MSTQITHDEWIAALEAAQSERPADDEGMTTQEIAEVFGVSTKKCRELLKKIQREGRIQVGRRHIARIDGTMTPVAVYRITEA